MSTPSTLELAVDLFAALQAEKAPAELIDAAGSIVLHLNDSAPRTTQDAVLFQRLREWRLQAAKAKGTLPYLVLHDKTLREIAHVRPATKTALRRVPGLGPLKLDLYGSGIIAVVKKYA